MGHNNADEPILFDQAIDRAIAAAKEADEAQESRDNRIGLIDPDTSARRALAWAAIAHALTTRNIEAIGVGP